MHAAFEVHMLNEQGKRNAHEIAKAFNALLERLKPICPAGREMALVVTKLEEAAFFAKKSMASEPANQENAQAPAPSGTAELSGYLCSGTRQPIPDAVVTATSSAVAGEVVVVTDGIGRYRMPGLPYGMYTLYFEKAGFVPRTVTDLYLGHLGNGREDTFELTGEPVVRSEQAAR